MLSLLLGIVYGNLSFYLCLKIHNFQEFGLDKFCYLILLPPRTSTFLANKKCIPAFIYFPTNVSLIQQFNRGREFVCRSNKKQQHTMRVIRRRSTYVLFFIGPVLEDE